ncbi:MAG: polysaccharide export protein [Burkholderiales bacterium]|nr:polysaccharide export protein [Burkholderiales bacterium]OJX08652.1 MAG: sugar ABC transporter substrate-binding protein [Burkholderiales bacterium 70-64]
MRSSSMFRIFAALLAALFVAGCASTLPPAPSQAAQPEYRYIIGPGDSLNIVVWRNPELSSTVPVRPDGRITTPLVEDMVAQGKNPSELAREIETALKKYLQDPVVTVVVQSFGGGNSEQVRVLGQAVKPATLPYRQNMTLLDVMIAVGGLTDFAAGNRAVLIRGSEQNKGYNVRLADLIKRGDVTANIQVLPGDVIIIPESWF